MSEPRYPEYFNLTAEQADHYCEGSEHQRVREVIASLVEPGEKVLEVGCGQGIDAERYAPESYLGIDLSPALVAAARLKHPQHRFYELDAMVNLLPAGTVDIVYAKSVLEHTRGVADALAILRNMLNCAKRLVAVAWHTPPGDVEKLARVRGHFGYEISQNIYARAAFAEAIGHRTWKVRQIDNFQLWEVQTGGLK